MPSLPLDDRRRALLASLGASLLGSLPLLATAPAAQAAWPDRPIRLVVGFPPGGGADFAARIAAQHLGQALGASVVVDNRPGANGVLAAAEVARAPADGHTLLLGVTASQSIAPVLGKPPYDPLRDFTPVTMIGHTPLVLVVNPKLPVKTVGEFIRHVNAGRDPLPYGSAGTGNITHMVAELFALSTGTQARLRHIPYKGSTPAITDLIGGHIGAYFDTLPSALPYIQSGQLRALAVTSRERAAAAPDLPTMQEAGVANYQASTWFGLLAPARLSPELAERLHDALRRSLGTPEARQALAARGLEPTLDGPARFQADLEADLARWREVTRKAGITLD